jgi:hypothetical protein
MLLKLHVGYGLNEATDVVVIIIIIIINIVIFLGSTAFGAPRPS